MDKSKASLRFIRANAANKVLFGDVVIAAISANATLFPALPVSITELQDVNYKLQKAAADAKNGDKTLIKIFKAAQLTWNNKLRSTAFYVSYVSQGNEQTISKAGFEPTKVEKKRRQRAGMLSGLKVTPGAGKGTCVASCHGEKELDGYVCVAASEAVKVSMSADTLVLNVNGELVYIKTSSRRMMELDSLPSSKPICVSMYGFNSAGSSPLAPSIEVTPQ